MSEIDDRRQRAREAAWDEIGDAHTMQHHRDAIESGVIVATQVKITREAVQAYYAMAQKEFGPKPRLAAFLTALGFEVIE